MLLAGKGILLTSDTPIASPPPPAPHTSPRRPGKITPNKITNPANARCSPTDQANGLPSPACSKNISASACIRIQGLGNDAHVGDAGAFDCVHHRGERAERHIFIGADEYRLILRVADLLAKFCLDLVDIDRIVPKEDALLLVDADHHPFFSDLFHGARPRN